MEEEGAEWRTQELPQTGAEIEAGPALGAETAEAVDSADAPYAAAVVAAAERERKKTK